MELVRLERLISVIVFIIICNKIMTCNCDPWPEAKRLWPRTSPYTEILYENQITEIPNETLKDLIKKSSDFPIKFPTNSTRCATLKDKSNKEILEGNINTAYPLLHEKSLQLFIGFLNQKRRFGNEIERVLYQNMSLLQLVDRLLIKRAVTFYGTNDWYLLLDGSTGKGKWETVGTAEEAPPLTLQNCLSYDEIKLSALLSVSSNTYFINHQGKADKTGVVIGSIGPSLDKEFVMEYREIMKTSTQNTHTRGYGESFAPTLQGIFINFYGDASLTYEELVWGNAFNSSRYIKISENKYFDKEIYKKRLALSIDCVLLEANSRAQQQNKDAALQIVKLGQGTVTNEEYTLFIHTVKERILILGQALKHVKEICFPPEFQNDCDNTQEISKHPLGGIRITNGIGCGSDEDLKVITYNWNGNALPGNEFWLNHHVASREATFTQILELHNSHINNKIRASNLKIVSPTDGIVSFAEYLNLHKNDN